MMRLCRLALVGMLIGTALPGFASKEETLQELLARAESARPEDRPGPYVEAAERQLKAADNLYEAGKSEEAKAAVNDVATYSQKAQEAALQSGKRLKQTEIALRKMAARLRDIKRTLSFEDQAPVQAAADQLENLRTDLQKRMFSKNK
jgi:polyhydroxyalkanoate synthesis regulator phasin